MKDVEALEQRLAALRPGSEIFGRRCTATAQRIEWYGSAMLTAATGTVRSVGANIHTDKDFARRQGLPDAIADGMICTNWLSSMLLEHFGHHYLERGELRAKFIKPIFAGMVVTMRGRVDSIEELGNGNRSFMLTVWCEDDEGVMRTEGNARVVVGSAG